MKSFLSLVCATSLSIGCSTSIHRAPFVLFDDRKEAKEIHEEDIVKAFQVRPQMPAQPTAALFSTDAEHAESLEKSLRSVERIGSVHTIRHREIAGERLELFDAEPVVKRRPVSIKMLRLLAAKHKADLTVVVDYAYRVRKSTNGLVVTSVLLLPILFMPMADVQVDSQLEAYVIDTRTGVVFGRVQSSQKSSESFFNVFSSREQDLIVYQRNLLWAEFSKGISEVLSGKSAQKAKKADSPFVSSP